MKENDILKILKELDKKLDHLPEPSSAEEAHEMVDILTNILDTLEKLEQKINPQ